MLNKNYSAIKIVLILFSIHQIAYSQSKVGTTAASFLGISVGPKATSMGGAFAAVSDDATSLYYNPGGFARVGKTEFVFAHTDWFIDSKFNWLGFMFNMDGTNAIGVSFTYLDYGNELLTTVDVPEGTGEKWYASDMIAGISYGRNLTDRFSIGGTVKYIQEKLYNESASAFALDIGLLFITQFNDLRLGMSISNFGTDMKFEGRDLLKRIDLVPDEFGNNETIVANLKTDSWPLPLFFRVGLAMDVIKTSFTRFTLAVDAFRPSDNTETMNIGAEFAMNNWVFLRAGYKSLFREDSEEGLTMGAGLSYPLGATGTVGLDYCFMDFGLLESVHMFAFKIGL